MCIHAAQRMASQDLRLGSKQMAWWDLCHLCQGPWCTICTLKRNIGDGQCYSCSAHYRTTSSLGDVVDPVRNTKRRRPFKIFKIQARQQSTPSTTHTRVKITEKLNQVSWGCLHPKCTKTARQEAEPLLYPSPPFVKPGLPFVKKNSLQRKSVCLQNKKTSAVRATRNRKLQARGAAPCDGAACHS